MPWIPHLTTHSSRSEVFSYFLSTTQYCSHLLLPEQWGCMSAWPGGRGAQVLVEVTMTFCPDWVAAPHPLGSWHFCRHVTFLDQCGQTMPVWWVRAVHPGGFWGPHAWPLDGRVRDRGRGRREKALTFCNFSLYKNKLQLLHQFDLSQCSDLCLASFIQCLKRKVLIFPLHLEKVSWASKDIGSAHPLKVATPI